MVNNESNLAEVKQNIEPGKEKKKSGFGSKFVTFLSMGGFLVVIIVIAAVAIGISLLTGK